MSSYAKFLKDYVMASLKGGREPSLQQAARTYQAIRDMADAHAELEARDRIEANERAGR